MDADALAALEYPAIVERLAAAAETPRGAELARGLVPSPERGEVDRRRQTVAGTPARAAIRSTRFTNGSKPTTSDAFATKFERAFTS